MGMEGVEVTLDSHVADPQKVKDTTTTSNSTPVIIAKRIENLCP